MKVCKVDVSDDKDYTFDLNVEDVHEYALSNGLIVHNSSVAVGATNGLYPIRSWTLIKTNADNTTYWAAPDSDRLHNAYEIAWDVPTKDLIEMYAIVQKFMDQGISADLYRKLLKDDTIGTAEMLTTFFLTMPLKSRYYMNIRTTEIKEEPETQGCESGACTL